MCSLYVLGPHGYWRAIREWHTNIIALNMLIIIKHHNGTCVICPCLIFSNNRENFMYFCGSHFHHLSSSYVSFHFNLFQSISFHLVYPSIVQVLVLIFYNIFIIFYIVIFFVQILYYVNNFFLESLNASIIRFSTIYFFLLFIKNIYSYQ